MIKFLTKILNALTWLGLLIILAFLLAAGAAILDIANPSISTTISIFTAGCVTLFTWQMRQIQEDQHKTNVYKLYWETILHSKYPKLEWFELVERINRSNLLEESQKQKVFELISRRMNDLKKLDKKSAEIKKLIQNQYDDLVREVR